MPGAAPAYHTHSGIDAFMISAFPSCLGAQGARAAACYRHSSIEAFLIPLPFFPQQDRYLNSVAVKALLGAGHCAAAERTAGLFTRDEDQVDTWRGCRKWISVLCGDLRCSLSQYEDVHLDARSGGVWALWWGPLAAAAHRPHNHQPPTAGPLVPLYHRA
jgi:hypothetical protein